ncbi:MAG: GNAT family N-acetyltransferase [Oscillospiraceae bacterium]|jgi:GNAT superfamily N-acetyltransferase|nr:GNAT family N-acetyltransferase [Oscillospiraceae bacterium]
MIRVMTEFEPWDVVGAQILASWRSYRTVDPSAQFWLQSEGQAAVSLIDGLVLLSAREDANFDELRAFLRMLPVTRLRCDEALARQFPYPPEWRSILVRFVAPKQPCGISPVTADDPGEVYDLLARCFDSMGDRARWMADMALRWRAGTAQTWIWERACSASALALTEQYCFLGAVGTLPEHRGRGLAGQLLGCIAQRQLAAGRKVFLSCREELLPFYENVGFALAGRQITMKKEDPEIG